MTRALVLAAGRGSRLGRDVPKALVEFAGRELLAWQLDVLRPRASEVGVVTGYRAELFEHRGLRLFHNDRHASTNMVASLFAADRWLDGAEDLLVVYGDVLFEPTVVEALLDRAHEDVAISVNTRWRALWEARFEEPLTDAETLRIGPDREVVEIGRRPRDLSEVEAQYMGVLHLPATTHSTFTRHWVGHEQALATTSMTEFLQLLVDDGVTIRTTEVEGGWVEFDTAVDYSLYEHLLAAGALDRFIDLSALR
ncbi:phosphocholine cytidylyltransferase family protein [Actinosynnema sp. NPDC051121]